VLLGGRDLVRSKPEKSNLHVIHAMSCDEMECDFFLGESVTVHDKV
jgi:hypothetical protein